MCGASKEQKEISQAQTKFYNTMTNSYQQAFGNNQAIQSLLTAGWDPIFKAGINQEGFSGAEKAALQTGATEKVAGEYAKAAKALGESQAARGGGNVPGLSSGADEQAREELAAAGAKESSTLSNQITEEDYALGRQNYLAAAGALSGVAAGYNPVGYAGAATGAGSAAAETANQIAQANNAWMAPVFGAVGGVLGGGLSPGGFLNKGSAEAAGGGGAPT